MEMKTNHRQRRVSMLLPLCLFTSLSVQAQTFTQRIQQTVQGEGSVTIHQSKEIDDLVNAPAASVKKPATTTTTTTQKSQQQEKSNDKTSAPAIAATTHENDTLDVAVATTTPHHTRKVMGYRVQAFAGGNTRNDRQKAEQTANAIRTLFPSEAVYTHFYNPRWICRVGNYPTYEEARRMLKELRSLGYSSATIVKGKITVPY